MKVEIFVDKDKFEINVEGYTLDVFDELGKEYVTDVIKKSVWLFGIAHEVKRRYTRFVEIEKRQYMAHWKLWAFKWLQAKGMKDTSDNLKDTIAMMFGSCPVKDKVKFVYDVEGRKFPDKKLEIWRDFFNDDSIQQFLKDCAREMYRIEFEQSMTYDRIIDMDSRMFTIVESLISAAEGYKSKSFEESGESKKVKKLKFGSESE